MFKFCAVFSISLNVSFLMTIVLGWGVMLVPLSCPICISSVSIYTHKYFLYNFVASKSCSNLYDGEYKLPVQVKEWREDLKYSPTAYL